MDPFFYVDIKKKSNGSSGGVLLADKIEYKMKTLGQEFAKSRFLFNFNSGPVDRLPDRGIRENELLFSYNKPRDHDPMNIYTAETGVRVRLSTSTLRTGLVTVLLR